MTPPVGHADLRRRITAWSIEWWPVPHHGIMQAFALLADCAAALDEVATLRAERDRLRAALAEHAIQCPQCQDVALRAALTPSPEETTNEP